MVFIPIIVLAVVVSFGFIGQSNKPEIAMRHIENPRRRWTLRSWHDNSEMLKSS